jgi:hypothetical protein
VIVEKLFQGVHVVKVKKSSRTSRFNLTQTSGFGSCWIVSEKTKIYLVIDSGWHDNSQCYGAFSSLEAAQNACRCLGSTYVDEPRQIHVIELDKCFNEGEDTSDGSHELIDHSAENRSFYL